MTDIQQTRFEGWAIVDVLGHQRYVGYVTTEAYGAAVMFRVDVPALEPRTRTTERPGYVGDRYLPAGATVEEGAVPGYTKLIGAGSIYTLTPCTQEAALAAVESTQPRPLMQVALPPDRALAEGRRCDHGVLISESCDACREHRADQDDDDDSFLDELLDDNDDDGARP